MKQEAKACAIQKKLGGVNSLGVNSPKTKNNSVSGSHQMFKHDGDNNAFDENDQLDEQYRKVIGAKETGNNLNTRTFSGPIVFSGQHNLQSNDCLLRQVTKDKQLSKNESQPPSNKDYMKMGRQINQKSSKLLQNQFNVQ